MISSSLITLESIFVEQTSENYRPDITAITEDGEYLEIEIFVTHTVGELKQIEARDRGQKMIEIDLSDLPYDSEFETVRNRVLYSAPRKWISHPETESILSTLTPMETESLIPKESLLNNILGVYSTNCYSDNQDWLVFGFKSGKGFSPKYNSNFELSKLYVAIPVQRSSTRNFSIDASSGFEFEEIEFDEICLDNLKLLTFPCVLNLRIGSRIRGRMSIPVVTGLRQIKI